MTDEIAGDAATAKRQSKTRQFYGFMGVTNYSEAFIHELSRDFERMVTIATMLLCHSKNE